MQVASSAGHSVFTTVQYTTVREASYNCYYKTGLNKSLILSFSPPLTQNVGIKEGDQVRECMLAVCHYDIV